MRLFIFGLLLAISYAQTECKNFGRTVDGVCECTPNYTGETCETRRTYEGWQWFVMWTEGETCADKGYFPISSSIECLIAARELYNWEVHKVAMTKFDEEDFPGCWTSPGVGTIDPTNILTAAADLNKWDLTKKLVCKHLLNEEVPPQIKSRLVDGTTGQPAEDNKGLLQVWDLHWNYWCDGTGETSNQDLDAVANLACMEMGYSGVESILGNQWSPNKWEDAVAEIFIWDFDCLGTETSLFHCGYDKGFSMPDGAIEVTCNPEALVRPTAVPTVAPTFNPTAAPTFNPTANPTAEPTSNCKNFGRAVDGVCECTPNYTGETCETRRTFEGWQWFVMWTEGETCADKGYFPIRTSVECMIASRELYNWDPHKMAMTKFDEEGFPGCWTSPGVGSINLNNILTAAADINKWDLTKKLVCKHLIDEEVPPQVKSRLVDGTTGQPSEDNKGLLQVWDLDWNNWCDAGKTSKQDLDAVANLACVEMGYSGVASIRGHQGVPNQDWQNEILIGHFDCLGPETSPFHCDYVKGIADTGCHPDHAIEVTCTSKSTQITAPIVDTGNCAWESHWFWGGDDFCSCRGGYVKIGRWGIYSKWQKVEGSGVRCEANQLGDPLWGVTKECRCGQRGGKVENNSRRKLKIHPLA